MLMVIFGAGASYDSDPARMPPAGYEHRPPLANELFQNRVGFASDLDAVPAAKPIVPFLRGETPVEQILGGLLEEAEGPVPYPERHRQLAAVRWYLQLMLGHCGRLWLKEARNITNYLTLLDEIRRWANKGVLLVTFNYDTLLEDAVALCLNRSPFIHIDAYIGSEVFSVIKLHGSVNWARRVVAEPIPQYSPDRWVTVSIDTVQELAFTNEFVVDNQNLPVFRDPELRPLFPAIAIPVQTKQRFECPDKHLEHLRSRLPEVDRVLIVGWRGKEAHFVKLLHDHLTDRVVFEVVSEGTGPSQQTIEELQGAGVRGEFRVIGNGFSYYAMNRSGQKLFKGD